MTNALRKAIMARSRLKNLCLKNEILLIGDATSMNEIFVLI